MTTHLPVTPRPGIHAPGPVRDLGAPHPVTSALFLHPVTVGWGDCDPAQIAYTANIPGWGLRAVEAWYRACLGIDWYQINLDHGIGTPFVNLGFDFHSPITPRSPLDVVVWVSRLGRSSLTHLVEGHQGNRHCFTGTTTCAFVDTHTLASLAIPPNMRVSIEQYQALQGQAPVRVKR